MARWYVKITTELGWFWLDCRGYKTKREAVQIADQAKKIPQNIKVEVVRG